MCCMPLSIMDTTKKDYLAVIFFVGRSDGTMHIAPQSALLAHPKLRFRYRAAHLFAKNMPLACFLNAKTLSGFKSLSIMDTTKKDYLAVIFFCWSE